MSVGIIFSPGAVGILPSRERVDPMEVHARWVQTKAPDLAGTAALAATLRPVRMRRPTVSGREHRFGNSRCTVADDFEANGS